ncbi:MAG: methyl-accepting chemotaxis protein [Desulfobacteraceae bacterium]|nr:methyl-accepting chemotaxis protein [Desulfobacteraceae bacterium]
MNAKRLDIRITLYVGLCLLVTVATICVYSAFSMRAIADHEAQEIAVAVARENALVIVAELEVAMDAARTMAQVLATIKTGDSQTSMTRHQVNDFLKEILKKNPSFIGSYTLWEPNAFDGKDAEHVGAYGHDRTGRFIPYWTRGGNGQMVLEALMDYETAGPGDYYQLPKTTKLECIIDPYTYPIQGKDVLLTSLVVPIIANGTFCGIAGIDLRLDYLQQRVDQIHIFDGAGRIGLISNNGTVAGFTEHGELVGKNAETILSNKGNSLLYIARGENKFQVRDGQVKVFSPIKVGHSATPWSVYLVVPKKNFSATGTLLIRKQIGIGTICTLIALVLIWIMAKGIERPIDRIIDGLNQGTVQVSSAAEQLSSSSQMLAAGASEQAASFEETSSSLEEMSSMSKQNADSANQANSLSNETQSINQSCSGVMQDMAAAIGEVNDASLETKKIVQTIDEIAFQTNLLALNAAVEAARAGEIGAGFAVVADEVRNLALRASEAAKNTSGQIEHITRKINDAMEMVFKSVEEFDKVGQNAGEVNGLVAEISTASNEQAGKIEQVNATIAEMSKVTQETAANAEQSAAASEELNAQAGQMEGFVKELVALVGKNITTPVKVRGAAGTTGPGARKVLAPPGKKRAAGNVAHRKAKIVRPDQIIPMDDDFKDF